MRLIYLLSIGLVLLCQSTVDPNFHYPKSPQIQVLADAFEVRALKGTVKGDGGIPIAGRVLVELIRGPDDEARIDAVFSDENGSFDFGKKANGRYYVKVSVAGWDTLYFPVRLGPRGRQSLRLALRLST